MSTMNTAQVQSYTHSPLPDKHWIRLLRLPPRPERGPVIASLEAHELDDNITSYTSLSYSWGRNSDGDASLSREIFIHGQSLAITENLHDCLLRIRPRPGRQPLLLWVDAVCINQNDIEERNAQVAMMADIYKKASRLLIWLGEDQDGDSDAAAARTIFRRTQKDEWRPQRPNSEILEHLDPMKFGVTLSRLRQASFRLAVMMAGRSDLRGDVAYARSLYRIPMTLATRIALGPAKAQLPYFQALVNTMPNSFMKDLSASMTLRYSLGKAYREKVQGIFAARAFDVAILCQRRYFSRRWVVQEISYSNVNTTFVQWGGFRVTLPKFQLMLSHPWHDIDDCKWFRLRDFSALEWARKACSEAQSLVVQEYLRTPYGGTHVLRMLEMFDSTSCGDDRDQLFSLSSMFEPSESIAVDYVLSTSSVYTQFASNLTSRGCTERVLRISARQWMTDRSSHNTRSVIEGLPSWVPDLRCGVVYPSKYRFAETFPYDDEGTNSVAVDGALTVTVTMRAVRSVGPTARVSPRAETDGIACHFHEHSDFWAALKPLPQVVSTLRCFALVGQWAPRLHVGSGLPDGFEFAAEPWEERIVLL